MKRCWATVVGQGWGSSRPTRFLDQSRASSASSSSGHHQQDVLHRPTHSRDRSGMGATTSSELLVLAVLGSAMSSGVCERMSVSGERSGVKESEAGGGCRQLSPVCGQGNPSDGQGLLLPLSRRTRRVLTQCQERVVRRIHTTRWVTPGIPSVHYPPTEAEASSCRSA